MAYLQRHAPAGHGAAGAGADRRGQPRPTAGVGPARERLGLATLAVGSEAGFTRFLAGESIAAAIHLHALEDPAADANVATLHSRSDVQDVVLIGFCRREQGFLLAPGNPLGIKTIEDVIAKRARITMRPKGAGAQLLLLSLLHGAKASLDQLDAVSPVSPTGPDIAQAVRAGRADTGIATRGVANAAGLDFVPIVWEHFDLAMRQRDYFHPPLQARDPLPALGGTRRPRPGTGWLRHERRRHGAVCDLRRRALRHAAMNAPDTSAWPDELRLHKDRKTLTVSFEGGERYDLAAEYLRVKSPSAEVQGHSAEERKTVPGKKNVAILEVLPVGNYAVRLVFDDMHSTGIYSWDTLRDFGRNHDRYWKDYLDELASQNLSRDPPVKR